MERNLKSRFNLCLRLFKAYMALITAEVKHTLRILPWLVWPIDCLAYVAQGSSADGAAHPSRLWLLIPFLLGVLTVGFFGWFACQLFRLENRILRLELSETHTENCSSSQYTNQVGEQSFLVGNCGKYSLH